MEDASRGYGMLLSACGLRTEEMQAQYSTQIKEKVNLKGHLSYSINPELCISRQLSLLLGVWGDIKC